MDVLEGHKYVKNRKVKKIIIITARVRSTREGNIYTWECLSVHNCGGGWGGTPSEVWWQGGGGYPIPGLAGGGYPIPGLAGGGVPHPQTWDWVPPLDLGPGTPPPEHLIRGGRYASCVHAGGLSCFL